MFLLALVLLASWCALSVTEIPSSRRVMASLLVTLSTITVVQVLLSLIRHLDGPHLIATVLATAVPTLLLSILYQILRGTPSRLLPPFPGRAAIAWTILVLLVYGWVARVGALIPPLGWDALTYHLPLLFQARMEHALVPLPVPARNAFYPLFAELPSLWNLLLSNRDPWTAVSFGGLPFVALGSAAVYSIAISLRLSRARRIFPVLFALTPLVLIHTTAGYSDLAFASVFLTALAFLVGFLEEGRSADLRLFALSLGALFATKLVVLYFGLPLFLIWLLAVPRAKSRWRPDLTRIAKDLPALLLLFFLLPGFWFGRNAVLTGNPIYPTPVQIGPYTLLEGPKEPARGEHQERWFVSQPAEWILYPLREKAFGRVQYSIENGFGAAFPIGLVGTLIALASAWRRKERLLLLVLAAVPITIALWFTVHLYREPRYIAYLPSLALIGPFWLAERMSWRRRRALHQILVAAALFSTFLTLPRLVAHAQEVGPALRAGTFEKRHLYEMEFGPLGQAWSWLSDRTRGDKATVAFTYGELIAPLYGDHAENRVVYVHDRWTPYPNTTFVEEAPFFPMALREKHAKYLFVSTPKWAGGNYPAAEWARSDPANFEALQRFGEDAAIYRVRSGKAALGSEPFPFPVRIDLAALEDSSFWKIEEVRGTALSVASGAGGLALSYRFQTPGNDYGEIAARPGRMDMSGHQGIRFRLRSDPARGVLFVYIKESDEARQMRFALPLAGVTPEGAVVTLNFERPERRSDAFDLRRVASIHLVVDDEPDSDAGDGRLTLSGIQLIHLP